MKKIIAFGIGTIALVGAAVGVQAFATNGHDENKQPSAATQTSPGSTTKPDDGQRDGFTEDHTGKPGETK
ncbi:hypothetical protein [Kribbella sp. NPDC055071]